MPENETNPQQPNGEAGTPGAAQQPSELDHAREALKAYEAQIAAYQKKETDAKAAQEAQARKELEAKGEFEKIAQAAQAEVDRLKGELAATQHAALKARIARENNLPDELAARLVGKDEIELKADAKALAKLVTTAATSAGNRPNPAATDGKENVTDIRKKFEQTGRYAM